MAEHARKACHVEGSQAGERPGPRGWRHSAITERQMTERMGHPWRTLSVHSESDACPDVVECGSTRRPDACGWPECEEERSE